MAVRVSIVIPAYNNARFIEATLDSVLAQTFTDMEVIVADHSSVDGTESLARTYESDPRVRVITTPAGGGAVRNWDAVSQEATGEYLKLVCGDDLIHPEIVARQVAALDAEPTATLVASRRSLIDANGAEIMGGRGLPGMSGLIQGVDAIRASVRAGSNVFGEPACVMFRREVLADVGWWDNTNPYLIDQATYARVLARGDLVALPDVLASFRLSSSQWSVELMRSQFTQAAAFHKLMRAEHATTISAADVVVGDTRARLVARLRRLAYRVFRKRMGQSETASAVEKSVRED